jgi:hypothetical protein
MTMIIVITHVIDAREINSCNLPSKHRVTLELRADLLIRLFFILLHKIALLPRCIVNQATHSPAVASHAVRGIA